MYPLAQYLHPLLMGRTVKVRPSGLNDGVIVYEIDNSYLTTTLPAIMAAIVGGSMLTQMLGALAPAFGFI